MPKRRKPRTEHKRTLQEGMHPPQVKIALPEPPAYVRMLAHFQTEQTVPRQAPKPRAKPLVARRAHRAVMFVPYKPGSAWAAYPLPKLRPWARKPEPVPRPEASRRPKQWSGQCNQATLDAAFWTYWRKPGYRERKVKQQKVKRAIQRERSAALLARMLPIWAANPVLVKLKADLAEAWKRANTPRRRATQAEERAAVAAMGVDLRAHRRLTAEWERLWPKAHQPKVAARLREIAAKYDFSK